MLQSESERGPMEGESVSVPVFSKVALRGPSLEVYVDNQLMLHQIRYKEKRGQLGLLIEKAEARFQTV